MLNTKLQQLRKSNRDLKDAVFLEHEDRYLLDQMFTYLWHKNLNTYDTECLRQDLLGMAQEAQQRKQTLREVIGDSRALCNDLAANCNKNRPLNVVCAGLSFGFLVAIVLCTISWLLQPQMLTLTADIVFGYLLLWWVLFLLWFRVIPLPYSFYNHTIKLYELLVVVPLIILYFGFLKRSQLYQEMLYDKVVLSIPLPANLIFIAALFVGYIGFRYIADTLAYRQSSFRK